MKAKRMYQVGLWGLIGTILLVMALACGCGAHIEMTYNPATETYDVYYWNNRPFAPENATIKKEGDDWEVSLGEQPTQAAAAESLIRLGATMVAP